MSKVTRVHLLLIDPQRDFCDPRGSLYVPGADKDMDRVAAMVNRLGSRLDDVTVTLDSHHPFQVFHKAYWKNSKGEHPNPFTLISVKDVESGTWTPTVPSLYKRSLDYVKGLEKKGRYALVVWPNHCLIGSEFYAVYPSVFAAVTNWEEKNIAIANYVVKGSNPFTEHYSAIASEIVDASDPSTQLNTSLISTLENETDLLLVAGEAKNFCVKSTVLDIISNFSDPSIAKKIVLLLDGMSDVPGFDAQSKQFIDDATKAGVQFSTTTDILK